jgi:hypothetical protein
MASMPDTSNRMDSPDGRNLSAPWQILLNVVDESAKEVADEIMADSVLADSIKTAISGYSVQHEKLADLRKTFAEADAFCKNLRAEAKELMASLGFDQEWDNEDISAVDSQLMHGMQEAAENAAAANKARSAASMVENNLLGRALDEIALCASIAVLRQMDRYGCEGEAFCVAYIATFLLREKIIDDTPATKAKDTLSEWLQYSIGVKTRAVDIDIYTHSRIASEIGRGMGINSSSALRAALIDAMKKCNPERKP